MTRIDHRDARRALLPGLLLSLGMISGCAAFSNRYRPVDIGQDMPSVSALIQAVQAAIDATADHPGWRPSADYTGAAGACSDGRADAVRSRSSACDVGYEQARADCAKAGKVGTGALCSDYFREAAAKCAAAEEAEPTACGWARLLAPPHITVVKLKLVAASNSKAGAGLDLKLLSAKASRTSGRRHTLEIDLVPRPEMQRQLLQARAQATAMARTTQTDAATPRFKTDIDALQAEVTVPAEAKPLYEALKVALQAATGPADGESGVRRLTLKRATYQFEIDYKRDAQGGFTWSVSPASGSFEAGSEQSAGNTLSIEVLR